MAATLDCDKTSYEAGDEVPPLWHWTYFLPHTPTAELGAEGHPKKGGFLPPIDLPRRMWAGSRIEFLNSVRVSNQISRQSTVSDITFKEGQSGQLAFVKVRHEISANGALALVEEQDIVYRNAAGVGGPVSARVAAPEKPVWRREIEPSPMLLFRYSALTFNSHRIHYDRRYAESEEGYQGLVVHGPLVATLLIDLLRRERPDARLSEFSFRAQRPLIDAMTFTVCGIPREDGTVRLWAQDVDGGVTMSAMARLSPA
jgi:3-methylfumaryl-CoA hydratase